MIKDKYIIYGIVLSIITAPIAGSYINQKFKHKKPSYIELESYALEPLKEIKIQKSKSEKKGLLIESESEVREKTINQINQMLKGKMANKGALIYDSCKNQNPIVNAKLLTSIIILESGREFNSYNVIHNNNISGMNWTRDSKFQKNGWYVKYESVDESIEDLAYRLSRYYIAQGLTTIDLIGAKYAPINDPRDGLHGMNNKKWVENVTKIYNQISEVQS